VGSFTSCRERGVKRGGMDRDGGNDGTGARDSESSDTKQKPRVDLRSTRKSRSEGRFRNSLKVRPVGLLSIQLVTGGSLLEE